MIEFEWDQDKNRRNWLKHKVSFQEAVQVFDDSNALLFSDDDHSTAHERRYILLGISGFSRVIIVIHSEYADNVIRIISARMATKNERKSYEEGI